MGHQSSMVFYLGPPSSSCQDVGQSDGWSCPPQRKGRATSPNFLPDFPPKKIASFFYMRRLWAAVWIVGVRNTGCNSFIICILLLCFQSDNVINFVLSFCGNIEFYNSITWDWVQSLKYIKKVNTYTVASSGTNTILHTYRYTYIV